MVAVLAHLVKAMPFKNDTRLSSDRRERGVGCELNSDGAVSGNRRARLFHGVADAIGIRREVFREKLSQFAGGRVEL